MPIADRFLAEEVDILNWKLKRAQDLQSMESLREKREALRQRRIRTRDAQIERELFEVEEQLVSERLPVSLAAKSATLARLGAA